MNDASLHVREMGNYAFWATAENSPELSVALLKNDDDPNPPIGDHSPGPLIAAGGRGRSRADRCLARQGPGGSHRRHRAVESVWPPPKPAVPALMRALSDPDVAVRGAAAQGAARN